MSYVRDLIIDASSDYNDPISFTGFVIDADGDGARITGADWIRFLNRALIALINVRPDSYAIRLAHLLTAGVYQTVPDDCVKLMDVLRNLGAGGITDGPPITKANKEDIEAIAPTWYSAAGVSGNITAYCYDERQPQQFLVYPRTLGAWYVEILYAASKSMVSYNELMPTRPNFDVPLVDYMLYSAYSIDEDSVQNRDLAIKYLNKFYSDLGISAQTQAMVGPKDEL